MREFVWKPDQKKALDHNATMALVASAGTGKTTILVEKFTQNLLELVQEHPREPEKALSRMVAITFTELAAAEMKSRVRARLRQEAEQSREQGDENKAEILHGVIKHFETAIIGTIHSFCRRLLQENYLEAGLAPNFQVLDEKLARQYEQAVVEEVAAEAVTSSPELAAFATRYSLADLEAYIVQIAHQLRADNKEQAGVEELLQLQEGYWLSGVRRLLPGLRAALESYINLVRESLAESVTKSKQEGIEGAERALSELTPFFNDPESLLDAELPEYLFDIKTVGKSASGKGIDTEVFKPAYLRVRELVGSDGKEVFNLKNLAGIRKFEQPAIRQFLTAVKAFIQRYNKHKRRQDVCDFEDLLLGANSLLAENPAILRRYREQFRWIFVDESQDVNEVQMSLIARLHGQGESGHLFMVGDGKQSIYKFRYADVELFNRNVNEIEVRTGASFSLSSNFRSHERLIKALNQVFSRLFVNDSGEDAHAIEYGDPMEAGRSEYPPAPEPLVEMISLTQNKDSEGNTLPAAEFNKKRFEAKVIAQRIKTLMGTPNYAQAEQTPLEYRDFAILLRAFTSVTDYAIELSNANIPYRVVEGKGFYQQREIWDLICYLKLIWFPADDYAFYTVLRSPLCLISDETMLAIARTKSLKLPCLLESDDWREAVDRIEAEKLAAFLHTYRRHHDNRGALSSAQTINEILEATGYDAVTLCKDDGDQRTANIRKLIELARAFESTGNSSPLEFALSLEEGMFDDKDEAQAPVFDEDENHIKIMTVHRSKGLEFPVVFLPHIHNKGASDASPISYDKQAGVGIRIPMEDSHSKLRDSALSIVRSRSSQLDMAEMLRLFYVASTRAKSRLILSAWEDDMKTEFKSQYSWLTLLHSVDFYHPDSMNQFDVTHITDTEILSLPGKESRQHHERDRFSGSDMEAAQKLLTEAATRLDPGRKTFTCGAWQLIQNLYPELQVEDDLEAPLEELYQEEEELESSPATRLGTIVHNWLELHFARGRHDRTSIEAGLMELGMPATEVSQAADAVNAFLNCQLAARLAGQHLLCEKSFTARIIDTDSLVVDVNGVIDLLSLDGNSYSILDYKYASSKESAEYESQMLIYSLACKHYFGRLPDAAIIYYLKDGVAQEVAVTEEKLAAFRDFVVQQLS